MFVKQLNLPQNERIEKYSQHHRDTISAFIQCAVFEGNESMLKLNVDLFNGAIFLHFIDDVLISISGIERSHYTCDHNVARICRYHILKKHRHSRSGFKLLHHQVDWAILNNIKLVYWTHDEKNRALNSLYQHRRTFVYGDNDFFKSDVYRNFRLIEGMRFKDSPKSDMLQFVYAWKIDPEFNWQPAKSISWAT